MTQPVTIRFESDDTVAALDRLAKATDRSRNWLINRAVDEYLALQAWQVGKIEAGLAAADRGDFASDDEISRIVGKFG